MIVAFHLHPITLPYTSKHRYDAHEPKAPFPLIETTDPNGTLFRSLIKNFSQPFPPCTLISLERRIRSRFELVMEETPSHIEITKPSFKNVRRNKNCKMELINQIDVDCSKHHFTKHAASRTLWGKKLRCRAISYL